MNNSLLAHLYPYIKGSQEDVATYSLQYLLSQSNKLNIAFTKMAAEKMNIELENKMQYLCQVTGESEEQERPDMVGLDSKGNETVLFEMKFYASLTQNQPNTYLKRLKKNNGKGLLFVCPMSRRTSLWAKLKELCNEITTEEISEYCIDVEGVKLSITTWNEIIEMLKQVSASTDNAFTSDILQLEGYCNKIDSDAFIPFAADDLSAKMAKMGERYYLILDEVINLILADKSKKVSKKGLQSRGYRKGYTSSLYVDDCTITLNYDRDIWALPSSVETPFWVAIRNDEWEQTESIQNALKKYPERKKEEWWGMTYLALDVLQNATFSEVCENLKDQIFKYIDDITSVEK